MANTIKFGNGQWATKEDSILAYNDENANFKPLPFVTSRATTATRVNKAGLLETVASGVPRVDYLSNTSGAYLLEPNSTNLITYSEAFGNNYWTKSGASIEGNSSTAGSEEVTNGDFATDTDWTKQTGWTISGGEAHSDGTGAGSITQSIPFEDGKTYKITFDVTARTQGSVRLFVNLPVFKELIETSDIGTHTVTVSVEGGSQTLHLYSTKKFIGSIDNISVKEVQGFSVPSVDSPLGAFKLVESSDNSEHRLYSLNTSSTADNTISIFAKKGQRTSVKIVSLSNSAFFDLDNGTILQESALGISKISHIGDGWYKCILKTDVLSGNSLNIYPSIGTSSSYQGDGTSGVYIFGAQLEAQSYATSYIPTKGIPFSRSADTASQTVPDGIIGQTEGTLFVEMSALTSTPNGAKIISLSDGTDSNRVSIYKNALVENYYTFRVYRGGSSIVAFDYLMSDITDSNKLAISYGNSLSDNGAYVNGVRIADWSSYDTSFVSGTLNTLSFDDGAGNGKLEADVKDLRVFNTRLSNSELQTLTTI